MPTELRVNRWTSQLCLPANRKLSITPGEIHCQAGLSQARVPLVQMQTCSGGISSPLMLKQQPLGHSMMLLPPAN